MLDRLRDRLRDRLGRASLRDRRARLEQACLASMGSAWSAFLPRSALTWACEVRGANGDYRWRILNENGDIVLESEGSFANACEAWLNAHRSYADNWETLLPDAAAS